MTPEIKISDVRFTPGSLEQRRDGLLGFVTLVLNDTFRIDGVMVRKKVDGTLALSFPAKHGKHAFLRPLNDEVRRHVETIILLTLGIREPL